MGSDRQAKLICFVEDMKHMSISYHAFINFNYPVDTERFRKVFGEHRFQKFLSRKIISVCSAHVQGLDENMKRFENRAVTHARNHQYRPIVFRGNSALTSKRLTRWGSMAARRARTATSASAASKTAAGPTASAGPGQQRRGPRRHPA